MITQSDATVHATWLVAFVDEASRVDDYQAHVQQSSRGRLLAAAAAGEAHQPPEQPVQRGVNMRCEG